MGYAGDGAYFVFIFVTKWEWDWIKLLGIDKDLRGFERGDKLDIGFTLKIRENPVSHSNSQEIRYFQFENNLNFIQ